MDQPPTIEAFTVLLRVIEWALVPLVLLVLFIYGFLVLPEQPKNDAPKRAARAARWAGLIILVLFVVSRKNRGDSLNLTIPAYDFSWLLTSAGVIGGFLLSWVVGKLRGPRAFGFFILSLVAGSSIAMYCYFFVQPARSSIIFVALGFALGTLLDRAFTILSQEQEPKEETKK